MKGKIVKNLVGLLLCASVLSGACACKNKGVQETPDDNSSSIDTSLLSYDGGIHKKTATETDIPFVKDGKTDYVLVLPKEGKNTVETKVLNDCKSEFPYLLKLATGIDIQVTNDEGLTHNANNTYISIGETTLFTSSGLTYDKSALGNDGTRIITKDKTVFLLGGKGYGALYAVYDFMELMFHFDVTDWDNVIIDKNVKNINLKNFDVTNVPDVAIRQRNISALSYPVNDTQDARYYGYRARTQSDGLDVAMPYYPSYDVNGQVWAHGHNSLDALPLADYEAEHKGWYSDNGNQLCYTAHGDENELRAMAEEVVKKTIFSLYRNNKEDYPLVETISLSVEDNYEFCSCDACKAMSDKYNSAGAILKFTNLYASIFKEWENGTPAEDLFKYSTTEGCEEWININLTPEDREKYIRDNFTFRLMAYNNMLIAPAQKNEKTGEYEPIDESCVLADNVTLYFADIEMDWSQSYFAEDNRESYENILAWSSLTKNPSDLYTYFDYPDRNLWFYDGFSIVTNESFAFLKNTIGIRSFYSCGISSRSGERETAFRGYYTYLYGKLLWDVNADVEQLTEKYFENEFGAAKDVMYNMFVEMRQYFAAQYEQFDLHQKNSIYNKPYSKSYWNKQTLKKWIDDCYGAFELIDEVKKSDADRYNALYCHIAQEMIYPSIAYLEFFEDEIATSERLDLVNRLLEDYEIMGLTENMMYFSYSKRTYLALIESWRKA